MTHGSILIVCSLILAGKEGQEILGPEAQADEAGCSGTFLPFPFVLYSLWTKPFVSLVFAFGSPEFSLLIFLPLLSSYSP